MGARSSVLLLAATTLWCQINRGVVEGIVTDPPGSVVPGAEVTITSVETNVAVATRTNNTGYYRVADLVPGRYKARFVMAGFDTLELTDIEVPAGRVTRVDAQLRLETTRQSVQVVADVPLVETGPSNFSNTVETKTIQEIPLPGRDLTQLAFLVPGVNNVGGPPGSNFGFNSDYGTFPDPMNALGSNLAVNGGQAGANAWYLDGNLNLASFAENIAVNPSPDAVQEFQAITNAFAPEYSRTGGAVFNVVLKSGTNNVHGNLYEFVRNDATNARNPFTSIDPQGKLIKDRQLRYNNFGGTLGGPVTIPGLYKGKDRTFFFFSWDESRLRLLGNRVYTVPTPRMRQGDFSEDENVRNHGIWDPFTTVGPDENGLFHRQPFLNSDGSFSSQIPKSRLDPVALFFINSYPNPNFNDPNSGCPMGLDGFKICDNFLGAVGGSQDAHNISLKIDHQWSDRSKYFVEWLYAPGKYRNYRVPWTGATFPTDQVGFRSNYPVDFANQIIALGNTYTFSPTLFNEFRAGFSRQVMDTNPSRPYPDEITNQSGVEKVLGPVKIPTDPFFPTPNFGISAPGGGWLTFGPTGWVNMKTAAEAYTILDNVTKVIGKHTLKAGFLYRLEHTAYNSGFPTSFSFTGNLVTDPNTGLGASGLAQFMLGAVSNSGRDGNTGLMWKPYQRFRYWGFFLQDDFRVTRNLTLNIGVRYDIYGYFKVRHGPMSNFCLTCLNELTGLKGKVIYEGDKEWPGGGRDIFPPNWDSIGPRVNFAWSLNNKTVIRGGYNIFYSNALASINSPGQAAANAPGWNQDYNWNGSFAPDQCAPYSGMCVAFPLSDTSTDKRDLTTPPIPDTFAGSRRDPLLGASIIQFFDKPNRDPMVQRWGLEIQRELPANMMASIGYVGSHGTHLVGEPFRQYNYVHTADRLLYRTALDANVPITDYFSGATAEALSKAYASPDGTPATELPRSILLKPYPFHGAISSLNNNTAFDGRSIYHGMNVRLQKRYSHGLDYVAAYTVSKKINNWATGNMATMLVDPIHGVGDIGGRLRATAWNGGFGGQFQDPDNKSADRAIAADDIPQMLNIAVTYELPLGSGKPFLNRKGAVNGILGGWRLTGNFNAQSGVPLAVYCPGNELTSRCNLIGDPKFRGDRSRQQQIAQWLNPAAFEPPFGGDETFWNNYDPNDDRAWRFGNASALLSQIRAPGFWNLDTAIAKQFRITETKYLDFRWEMFNALNHQNLGYPDTYFCLPPGPDGSTNAVRYDGCTFGRIRNIQTDPRAMQFGLKFFW